MKSLPHVMRRLAERPGLVFALVFAWKLALLVFTAQPVPANDSFFYDGPVVNFLLHGKYTNPSLALTFPISATKVFSAYPPFYQIVLLGWMSVFGTSALAAMWLHFLLFGAYILLVWAILRLLNAPAWCVHVAGAFLLVTTFHDRPDSLAQVLGMLAIYTWARSQNKSHPNVSAHGGWIWATVLIVILGLTTGPVIGGIYLLTVCVAMIAHTSFSGARLPLLPLAVMLLSPVAMIAAVASVRPDLWAGFMEHARQTPSLSNLRSPQLIEVFKFLRTVPGLLAVAVLTPIFYRQLKPGAEIRPALLTSLGLTALLAAGGIVVGCLFFLAANSIQIAAYFQPLVVGCFLTFFFPTLKSIRLQRFSVILFLFLALFGSIRAIGMTTWGSVCASNVSYAKALTEIKQELNATSAGGTVVLSAAFLYEAAQHENIVSIHSDWLGHMNRSQAFSFSDALITLKPDKLILTQFDYYRRYQSVLQELKGRPELVEIRLRDTANGLVPDAIPSMQRVVQHISWAPVIVNFSWKNPRP